LDKWSHSEIDAEMLAWALTPTATLDSPATAEDPDDLGDPDSTDSFDDRMSEVGSLRLGAYNSSHVLSEFSGPNLPAVFETGHFEPIPGRRSLLSGVRPVVDGVSAILQVASVGRRNVDMVFGRSTEMGVDGVCPARSDGRYHQIRLNIPGPFTDAVGFEPIVAATGMR
jgi:hypothetical protein